MLRKEEWLSGAVVQKTPEFEASWDTAHQKCEEKGEGVSILLRAAGVGQAE